MKQNTMYLLVVGIFAFCQSVMPFVGSKDYSFGVLTPRTQYKSPQLYTNRWAYFISVYMLSFVAANYIYRNSISPRGLIMILFFLLLAYLVLLVVYHQKLLDLKKTEAWTDTAILREQKGQVSQGDFLWAAYLLRVFLLMVVITGALYAAMPQQMTVLGVSLPKSYGALVPVALAALLGGVFAAMLRRLSKARAAVGIAGALIMVALLPLPFVLVGRLTWQAAGLYGVGAAVLAFAGGLLGKKLDNSDKEATQPKSLSDAHWKMGCFYLNKEDPAAFVPKRFGLGFTPNLASSKGIGLSLLPVAVGFWLAYRFILML